MSHFFFEQMNLMKWDDDDDDDEDDDDDDDDDWRKCDFWQNVNTINM